MGQPPGDFSDFKVHDFDLRENQILQRKAVTEYRNYTLEPNLAYRNIHCSILCDLGLLAWVEGWTETWCSVDHLGGIPPVSNKSIVNMWTMLNNTFQYVATLKKRYGTSEGTKLILPLCCFGWLVSMFYRLGLGLSRYTSLYPLYIAELHCMQPRRLFANMKITPLHPVTWYCKNPSFCAQFTSPNG